MPNRGHTALRKVAERDRATTALPLDWGAMWGSPSPFYRRSLLDLRQRFEELATAIPLCEEPVFEVLVNPGENARTPIHRWYDYKEAFSHRLPREVITRLGTGSSGVVADVFAGVATTALALQTDPRVSKVIGLEYSPFAHFVGETKLRWHELDARSLRRQAERLIAYRDEHELEPPELAAFHNPEIFDPATLASLLSAREAVKHERLSSIERAFFLVGLAAVVEEVSGAMKDGRALRILRNRRRESSLLRARKPLPASAERVREALAHQWMAMIEDLEAVAVQRSLIDPSRAVHLLGDARELERATLPTGSAAFPVGLVGLFVHSPPYPNAIDYSEIYKLELWLLEFVHNQEEFRELRLGTLRSHPSIDFPDRGYLSEAAGTEVADLVEAVSCFVERNHARRSTGRMIRSYFDDMYRVLSEQYDALEPGGHAVCIVANSTFSRRDKDASLEEFWRLPLLTDVVLARLGEIVGFSEIAIWKARDLQPRNVRDGVARESVVVMRKPPA